jgi:hypothetical protein
MDAGGPVPLLGGGHYRSTKVFFSMPGPWYMIVYIKRSGQNNSARFDFYVAQ